MKLQEGNVFIGICSQVSVCPVGGGGGGGMSPVGAGIPVTARGEGIY